MKVGLNLIKRGFDYLFMQQLRNIEIRHRLIGSLVLLSLLPLLISGYIAYVDSNRAIEEKTRIFSIEVVKQVSTNVKLRMTQIDTESADLVLSDRIQHALTAFAGRNQTWRSAARTDLTQALLDHYGSLDYINQKYFLDKNQRVIDTQVFAQLTAGVARFVTDANELRGHPYWGSYNNGVGQQNIGMVRTIISKNNTTALGALFLAIRPEHFSAIFDNVDLGSGADIFILDVASGKVVIWPQGKPPALASNAPDSAAMLTTIATGLKHGGESGFVTFNGIRSDNYLAAYAKIPDTSWLVVNTISKSRLTAEVQRVRDKMALIGVLCFLCAIVLAYLIARSISIPLKTLMAKMQATGYLAEAPALYSSTLGRQTDVEGQDELSQLTLSFAIMNDAVNQKIEQINEINATLEQKIRQRTAALEASEQESRSLIENSPDSIARYDLDCRRMFINPILSNMVQGGAPTLLGKTPSELPGGPNWEMYENKLREFIATGNNAQFEFKWISNEGREIYSHIRLTEERDKSGNIVSILGVGRDISELNHSRAELNAANVKLANMNIMLESLATLDPLTLLPNRRLLLERLQKALSLSERSGHNGALMFVDLDNFKTLNDTLGHDVGDLLLKQVADRLKSCVREADTVARLGGDEFVVMLENISEKTMEAAAQSETVGHKILVLLNQPYQLGKLEYQISASIGVTLFNDNRQTAEELLKQSDIAMYQAKKSGRNALRFFDSWMQDSVNARASLEAELRKAIDNRQFQLYYQIQVEDRQLDGILSPSGAEALIRWIHPELGIVGPDKFISLAEETGLILPIGQWVLDTACAQLALWQEDALTRDLVLAVNVSARQFLQADFVLQLQALIGRYGINPRRLKLELTESLLLGNIDETIANMNLLSAIGVMFSLDDFGTGYSSLQYLKRLPLDQLKIDQSFVNDIVSDASDRAIVSTIIAMAHSLNLDVIAEGVETEQQFGLLQSNGCRHYQGFLFGKPVAVGQFEQELRQRA